MGLIYSSAWVGGGVLVHDVLRACMSSRPPYGFGRVIRGGSGGQAYGEEEMPPFTPFPSDDSKLESGSATAGPPLPADPEYEVPNFSATDAS